MPVITHDGTLQAHAIPVYVGKDQIVNRIRKIRWRAGVDIGLMLS